MSADDNDLGEAGLYASKGRSSEPREPAHDHGAIVASRLECSTAIPTEAEVLALLEESA
jgi:hypothetical protein